MGCSQSLYNRMCGIFKVSAGIAGSFAGPAVAAFLAFLAGTDPPSDERLPISDLAHCGMETSLVRWMLVGNWLGFLINQLKTNITTNVGCYPLDYFIFVLAFN